MKSRSLHSPKLSAILTDSPEKSNRKVATWVAVVATLMAIPLLFFALKGLGTVKPPAEAGRQKIESVPPDDDAPKVEVYVAKGDSGTIKNALKRLPADGGRVILGEGIFPVHEPIVLDQDNVELRGQGAASVLRLADRAACPVVVIGKIGTPIPRIVRRVTLRHLVIDGNHPQQEPECWGGVCDSGGLTFIRNNCVTIRGAEEIKLEHLVTKNARSGGVVLEKQCRQIYIDGLESMDNFFDGLACYETEDSYFSRLHLHHNRAAGISLDLRFNHNVIKIAELHHNGSQGIFMRESNDNDFKRLNIHHNGQQGIFIAQADDAPSTSCKNNVFSDLIVRDNLGHGLRINDPSCIENLVRNSVFENNNAGNVSQVAENLLAVRNVTGM